MPAGRPPPLSSEPGVLRPDPESPRHVFLPLRLPWRPTTVLELRLPRESIVALEEDRGRVRRVVLRGGLVVELGGDGFARFHMLRRPPNPDHSSPTP